MRGLSKTSVRPVPTMVDLTEAMIDRAAQAILAAEAESRLTNCYGEATKARARVVARNALEAALDLRVDG